MIEKRVCFITVFLLFSSLTACGNVGSDTNKSYIVMEGVSEQNESAEQTIGESMDAETEVDKKMDEGILPINGKKESLEQTTERIDESEQEKISSVTESNEQEGSKAETMINRRMKIQIGSTELTATLENNASVDALIDILMNGPIFIDFSMYGGFEQVGDIGTELPRNDVQTTTSAGDIVLYSGNQMVMFYGSNSWAYTRLGKIDDVSASELEEVLGNGDVTAELSIAN